MRALACLIPLVAIAATLPHPGTGCPAARSQQVRGDRKPLVHSLSDEPGARQEIAVERRDVDGCVTPIVLRENVGGTSPPLVATDPTARHTSSVSRP